jgi:hypothetical protein
MGDFRSLRNRRNEYSCSGDIKWLVNLGGGKTIANDNQMGNPNDREESFELASS